MKYHTGHPIGEEKLRALGRRFLPERWRAKLSAARTKDGKSTSPDEPGGHSS
jgi:hypothetical protein